MRPLTLRVVVLATGLVVAVAPLPAAERSTEGKPSLVKGLAQQRVREVLDRGLVARPLGGGPVYLSWRLLPSDPADVEFDVYRRTGDAPPVVVNRLPLRKTTDFVDPVVTAGVEHSWTVRAAGAGMEPKDSPPTRLTPPKNDADVLPYRAIKLQGNYTFQKVAIADLDGDGQYDFVIKQPSDNIDPYEKYWQRSPDTYKLEAYRSDGTFLWRYDLGWAIERGIWYSPYLVYDFDGDGRAEVAVKTGEGDPRDADGRVHSGPERLTILNGRTGKPITQSDWPSRTLFGDEVKSYNYASRNQLGVAYLDGRTPCLIVGRGTYQRMIAAAYEYRDGKLRRLWQWDNEKLGKAYWGQGAHWMHAADVDGDGRDEVLLGSVTLDDDGQALWTTGLGHPDHFYVGDIDPRRPGLEIYFGIEARKAKQDGICLVDARTGEILWRHKEPTQHIHSSGLCSDIDPRTPGAECYSGERDFPDKRWLRDCNGTIISTKDIGGLAPRAAYWDADLQRELVVGSRILKYAEPQSRETPPRLTGSLVAVADITGDWREEIILSVPGEMRIYSTMIPAQDRRVCLMQDPLYRLDVAMAAMGYYQVPMTSYALDQ